MCDVDDAVFAKPVEAVRKTTNSVPPTEKDFRRLLDDKAIAAVAIAAPDHWHAILTVLACQAGKDVYIEKPARLRQVAPKCPTPTSRSASENSPVPHG